MASAADIFTSDDGFVNLWYQDEELSSKSNMTTIEIAQESKVLAGQMLGGGRYVISVFCESQSGFCPTPFGNEDASNLDFIFHAEDMASVGKIIRSTTFASIFYHSQPYVYLRREPFSESACVLLG